MEISRGVSSDPDKALHGLARPMEHLGPFGINPNVNITVDVVEDQQDPTRSHYKITGPKELCDHLAACSLAPEGRLSTICATTLENQSRRGKHIPLNAEYYAFMYPLSAVSKASNDQLTQCFGAGQWCTAIGLLCFGGFVYFGKDREVIRINAFSDNDQFYGFFVFEGPFDLPVSVAEELQSKDMAQPVTLGAIRAQLGSHFAWIGPEDFSKHFGGSTSHVNNIAHGAFAYLFENPKFNRYFRLTDGTSRFRGGQGPLLEGCWIDREDLHAEWVLLSQEREQCQGMLETVGYFVLFCPTKYPPMSSLSGAPPPPPPTFLGWGRKKPPPLLDFQPEQFCGVLGEGGGLRAWVVSLNSSN